MEKLPFSKNWVAWGWLYVSDLMEIAFFKVSLGNLLDESKQFHDLCRW